MDYASKSTGTAALTTGIIGTAGAALNSGLLGNLFGGSSQNYIPKDMADLMIQNAILSADLNTEKKIVDTYTAVTGQIRDLEKKVDANAAAQAVINAQYGSQLTLNNSQIAQLFAMTKLVIPGTNICPQVTGGTTTA